MGCAPRLLAALLCWMPFVSLLVVDVDIDVDIDICVDICEECGVSKEFEAVEDDSDPSMPRNHVELLRHLAARIC